LCVITPIDEWDHVAKFDRRRYSNRRKQGSIIILLQSHFYIRLYYVSFSKLSHVAGDARLGMAINTDYGISPYETYERPWKVFY